MSLQEEMAVLAELGGFPESLGGVGSTVLELDGVPAEEQDALLERLTAAAANSKSKPWPRGSALLALRTLALSCPEAVFSERLGAWGEATLAVLTATPPVSSSPRASRRLRAAAWALAAALLRRGVRTRRAAAALAPRLVARACPPPVKGQRPRLAPPGQDPGAWRALAAALECAPAAMRPHAAALRASCEGAALRGEPAAAALERERGWLGEGDARPPASAGRAAALALTLWVRIPRAESTGDAWGSAAATALATLHGALDECLPSGAEARGSRQAAVATLAPGSRPAAPLATPPADGPLAAIAAARSSLRALTALLASPPPGDEGVPLPAGAISAACARVLALDGGALSRAARSAGVSRAARLAAALPALHEAALRLLGAVAAAGGGSLAAHQGAIAAQLATVAAELARPPAERDPVLAAPRVSRAALEAAEVAVLAGGPAAGRLLAESAAAMASVTLRAGWLRDDGDEGAVTAGLQAGGGKGARKRARGGGDAATAALRAPGSSAQPGTWRRERLRGLAAAAFQLLGAVLAVSAPFLTPPLVGRLEALAARGAAAAREARARASSGPALAGGDALDAAEAAALSALLSAVRAPTAAAPATLPLALALARAAAASGGALASAAALRGLLEADPLLRPRAVRASTAGVGAAATGQGEGAGAAGSLLARGLGGQRPAWLGESSDEDEVDASSSSDEDGAAGESDAEGRDAPSDGASAEGDPGATGGSGVEGSDASGRGEAAPDGPRKGVAESSKPSEVAPLLRGGASASASASFATATRASPAAAAVPLPPVAPKPPPPRAALTVESDSEDESLPEIDSGESSGEE